MNSENEYMFFCGGGQVDMYIFLLLHRAYCRVTQLLHQPLHIYKIYTLKH